MENQLFANPDLCTGCNRCATICSGRKEGKFAPSLSRVKINNFPQRGYSVPSVCFQCPKADCMDSCPTGALQRQASGVVVVVEDDCTGCGACVDACTYGMIEMNDRDVAFKCDHCDGDPACVKDCFAKALTYESSTPEKLKLKGAQMKTRTKEGCAREKRLNMARKLLDVARP